jgi:hypothetical protein
VQRCLEDYAARILPEDPPATSVTGIDETRRGKPVWKQNPSTCKWELIADAWHIGFVDAIGGRGLFGQVEGRNVASVADWLSSQPASWREQVRYVAIDLCATFRAAVHRALPHATVVVDCFHIVQPPARIRTRRLTCMDAVLAENLIRPGHAACWYSWRMPPSRSRFRMWRRAICPGSVIGDR